MCVFQLLFYDLMTSPCLRSAMTSTDASLIENLSTRDCQSLVLVLAPGHHGAVKKKM